MADNLEKNIKQIAELLSRDDVVNSLKGILGDLGSPASQKVTEDPKENSQDRLASIASQEDIRFVQNMVRAMSELKNVNDPGANLLAALRPFLSGKRQKTCGDCVRVLSMARVFEFMQKHGNDFNF